MVQWYTTIEDLPVLSPDGPALHEERLEAQPAQLLPLEYPTSSSDPESNGSLCWLVALSYAYLAFKAEAEGIVDTDLLQRLTSRTMINEAVAISTSLEIPIDAYFDDLLKIPIFQTAVGSSTVMGDTSTVTCILMESFIVSCDTVKISILTNDSKIVVFLRVMTSGYPTYVLFDPSSLTDHSSGPSLRRVNESDQAATLLQEVLGTPCRSNTFSSAHMLRQKSADESDLGLVGEKNNAQFPREIISADDLACLPVIPEKPFVLHGPTPEPITLTLGDLEVGASVGTSAGNSNATDTSLDGESKPRWKEYVWPLSLQTLSPASMDSGINDNQRGNSGPLGSNNSLLCYRNYNTTSSVASSSKGPSTAYFELNRELHQERYAAGSSKGPVSPVSSGKRASQGSEKDNWETALLQQLQDEEEIASVLPSQKSSEYTWLVALQKKLQADERRTSGNQPSTSISSSELDWQLAVQLQQEVYQEENLENGTPRIVIECEDNDGDSRPRASGSSSSNTHSGHLRVPQRPQRICGDSFDPLDLYMHTPPEESFSCGVCGDMYKSSETIVLESCSHRYCKECLGRFVKTKIEGRKYPIFCPECLAERLRTAKTRILQDTIDQLELTSEERRKFCEIEMNSHSILLECPRCKERMNVDRDEYSRQSILICPLPGCAHKWCRSCLKTVASSEERHRCKNGNIDRLMRRKGWKYCPGCRTPVQKESGCNHMTCGAPGCNVHFCYRCGVLMIDTTNGGDVGTAVTDHYNECRLFERRFKCSIQ